MTTILGNWQKFLRCASGLSDWTPPILNSLAAGLAVRELARYAAMLVPHQFSRNEGLQFNPEALAIWVNHKLFSFAHQFAAADVVGTSRLKNFAQVLGFEIDPPSLNSSVPAVSNP